MGMRVRKCDGGERMATRIREWEQGSRNGNETQRIGTRVGKWEQGSGNGNEYNYTQNS